MKNSQIAGSLFRNCCLQDDSGMPTGMESLLTAPLMANDTGEDSVSSLHYTVVSMKRHEAENLFIFSPSSGVDRETCSARRRCPVRCPVPPSSVPTVLQMKTLL